MEQRNFYVDFVEFSANIIDGEFFEGVHHTPFNPGGSCYFCPDYLTCPLVPLAASPYLAGGRACNGRRVSFCLKSFLSVYR